MPGRTTQELLAEILVNRILSAVAIARLASLTDDPKSTLELLRQDALQYFSLETDDFEDAEFIRERARTMLNAIFDTIKIE